MKHLSASLRLLLVVGLLLLVVVCLGAGRPSQAAPGVLVNVKLSGPMAAGGQVAGQPFAISADNQYAVYVADPAIERHRAERRLAVLSPYARRPARHLRHVGGRRRAA